MWLGSKRAADFILDQIAAAAYAIDHRKHYD
jgi:hypothetical protein